MSAITDAQTLAIDNAQGEVITAGESGTAITITPVTATPFQINTAHAADLYITVVTSAALAIAMGPTAAVAVAVSPSELEAIGVTYLRVPAGWYVMLTGTMADLSVIAVLGY